MKMNGASADDAYLRVLVSKLEKMRPNGTHVLPN
ncbi:hypothetical protein X731_03630 [Mesorhizobium sp. L2C054A000]|nr:hypothetical protein X731_03630 [Mesorhizobium sp. L2C054A000]